MAGGVWSLTSAKRDKLGELKGALSEEHDTLDDMATQEESLDLYLADGIKLVVKATDFGLDTTESEVLKEFSKWLDGEQQSEQTNEIDKTSLGIKLELVSARLDSLLETVPSDRCLRNIRDFLDPEDLTEILKDYKGKDNPLDSDVANNNNNTLSVDTARFSESVTRYRLLLAKSAIDHLMASWDTFTTVSDADIDRAAAEGISLEPQLNTVALDKIFAFLQTTISGSCSDRVTAAWNLIDRDEDGSLDQDEMHKVVHLCLAIETDALQKLFEETLDAFPVRSPLSAMDSSDEDTQEASPKQGWRQKRAEKKAKKGLLKMFQRSCQKHFDIEVEIDHRLRCMYAWANKADQNNKVKSVMVGEQAGWTGRKRYVELSPKISEAEFREVQEIHFKHMNQLGGEILKSFREDLWVSQGKRRERKDLIRNSFLFLAGISAVDYVIIML